MPRRNLTILTLAAIVSLVCYEKVQRSRYAAVFAEALDLVTDRFLYADEIDRQQLFDSAMDGMVGALDEHSSFLRPEEYEDFSKTMDQQFVGIGVEVTLDPDTGRLTVRSPLVGSPAYKAGMIAGDTIVAIEGRNTEGMSLQDAVKLLRGKIGTEVRLSVLHPGDREPVQLSIVRADIPIESVKGAVRGKDGRWRYFLADHPHIGYVRISMFGAETVDELRRVLKFADHPVEGLILDLRFNRGGLLSAAVGTCDLFLKEGRIVSIKERDAKVREQYDAHQRGTVVPADLPVVVLVNHESASASEIVAACLQDHRRAVVVGQRTWGKGTVQNVFPLAAGKSGLRLTIASYTRPSGRNIHRRKGATEKDIWGVMPDEGFQVILTDQQSQELHRQLDRGDIVHPNGYSAQVKPPDDPQLQKAVEFFPAPRRHKPVERG